MKLFAAHLFSGSEYFKSVILKNIMIRPANDSDIPALARVHIASWQAAYRGLLPDDVLDNLSPERFEVNWKSHLANPQRTNFVLELERGVSGFIAFGASRDDDATPTTGEVYALYLLPECWGKGHAPMLWAQGAQYLAKQFPMITLWVLQDNTRARTFYERMGCELDGQAKNITLFGTELPQVRYRKRF